MTALSLPALPCPIAPFVPQRGVMCLLDTLVEVDGTHLVAEVIPDEFDPFHTHEGIPGWVGLEWLAQAVAAWAGWQAAGRGETPAIGFLIGSRRFETRVEHFPAHRRYRVEVHLEFRADNGLGHFRGILTGPDGAGLAEGGLTIFEPSATATDPAHPEP